MFGCPPSLAAWREVHKALSRASIAAPYSWTSNFTTLLWPCESRTDVFVSANQHKYTYSIFLSQSIWAYSKTVQTNEHRLHQPPVNIFVLHENCSEISHLIWRKHVLRLLWVSWTLVALHSNTQGHFSPTFGRFSNRTKGYSFWRPSSLCRAKCLRALHTTKYRAQSLQESAYCARTSCWYVIYRIEQ